MTKLTYYTLAILLLLASCDPVRRMQRNEERKQKLITQLMQEGICAGDTIVQIIRDTTIRVDTIGEIFIYSDTSIVLDTVFIKQLRSKDILRTITRSDTIVKTVTDVAGMMAVKDELDRIQNECKGMKAQRNVAYALLCFAIALIVIFVMVIAKPK